MRVARGPDRGRCRPLCRPMSIIAHAESRHLHAAFLPTRRPTWTPAQRNNRNASAYRFLTIRVHPIPSILFSKTESLGQLVVRFFHRRYAVRCARRVAHLKIFNSCLEKIEGYRKIISRHNFVSAVSLDNSRKEFSEKFVLVSKCFYSNYREKN